MDNDYLALESGKQRAGRLSLDYYRTKSWKPKSIAALLICVTVLCAAAAMFVGRGQANFSPGPLSRAHAAWDQKCQACHTGLSSISDQSAQTHISEATCQQCHQMPAHHANEQLSAALLSPNCVSCHLEHRGRDASLTRIDDRQCTSCHGNLSAHTNAAIASELLKGDPAIANSVETFDLTSHPKFRSRNRDPGNVAFNHQLHMSAGIAHGPNGKSLLSADAMLSGLNQEDKARYQKYVDARGNIQLACQACHELEKKGGEYAPVSFDRNCQACHSLTATLTTEKAEPSSPLALVKIPHHLQSDALGKLVRGLAIEQWITANPTAGNPSSNKRVDRRIFPGDEDQADLLDESAKLQIEVAVSAAKKHLRSAQGCGECHQSALAAKDSTADPLDFPHVPRSTIPQHWFAHAQFSHAAHGALNCQECHAGAAASTKNSDVLIPGPESCVQCHAAASVSSDGKSIGGAGTHCVECHAYHRGQMNAQRPPAQLGHDFMSNGDQLRSAPPQKDEK